MNISVELPIWQLEMPGWNWWEKREIEIHGGKCIESKEAKGTCRRQTSKTWERGEEPKKT